MTFTAVSRHEAFGSFATAIAAPLPRDASTRDLVGRLGEIAAALRAGGTDPRTAVDAEAAGIIDELKSRGTESALAAVAEWTQDE